MSKKVFIGVGHGGSDPGAVGYIVEKDVNLRMAAACADYLQKAGVTVMMSRTKDENDPVAQEIKECNAFAPDLAIDVHNNAGGGDGFEVICSIEGGMSRALAQNIEKEVKKIGQNSRGVKTRKNNRGTDYFGFIRSTKCPAVICEGVFVDNKEDASQADEPHEWKEFGEAYAKGILATLGVVIAVNAVKEEAKKETKKTAAVASVSVSGLPSLKNYKGSSIVDGLKSVGHDSSFTARKQIAQKLGILNYQGTQAQNIKMLSILRNL